LQNDPGKASEQYPGNPGQVVSAEEGVATKYNNNNVTVANVNTWAISPRWGMRGHCKSLHGVFLGGGCVATASLSTVFF